ncbi:MAG: family 43 glycosylhydrolase [Bacilli bacterium]
MKKNCLKLLLPLFLLPLSSCQNTVSNDDIIDPSLLVEDLPRDTYTNNFKEDKIPDYWPSYGCGDPYVLRYDGMFYLYVSTWPNGETGQYGVMAWKSKNLVDWEHCMCEGLEPGLVTDEDCTYVAYAPEVIHYNGYFYMVESRRGRGHYLLRSESPEGPFVQYSDNFGESIDGSLFVDDDEKIYFLRASNAGIRVNNFESLEQLDENNKPVIKSFRQLQNTQVASWTEGPSMIKIDNNYYLSYTGPDVTSTSYKVAYSYHTDTEETPTFFKNDAFTEGGIVALKTGDDFNGLGHSSFVSGPNLDSTYMVYHNLVSVNGPYRHYNLTRVLFNGTEMSLNHLSLEDNFYPQLPEFYTYDDNGLSIEGDFLLSNASTGNRFSVELNITGANEKGIFAYVDEANYHYVTMSTNNELSVYKVSNNNEILVNKITMNNTYNYSKNHTYKIVYDNKRLCVYFDTMKKIDMTLTYDISGGKIGYLKDAIHSYTAFSLEAFGSSQKTDYKQENIMCNAYDETISTVTKENNEILLGKTEYGNGFNYGGALVLNNNSIASYKTYFFESGFYGIDITVPTLMMGKSVGVRLDNGEVITYKVPKYSTDEDIIKVHLANINVENKGVHYISLYGVSKNFIFTRLDTYQTTDKKMVFENDLSSFVTRGATYVNSWKLKYGGHYASSGNRQLVYFGDETMRDYRVEVDITFDGDTLASTAGIMLRASDPSFHSTDDYRSIFGFYCGFNNTQIFIKECNYYLTLDAGIDARDFYSGVSYHMIAECIGNSIKLYIDDELILSYVTNLGKTFGHPGLYTDGAAAIYKNLKITTL